MEVTLKTVLNNCCCYSPYHILNECVPYCDSILRLTEIQSMLLETCSQSQEWVPEAFGTPGISLPLNLCRQMESVSCLQTNEGICQHSKQLAMQHAFNLYGSQEGVYSMGKNRVRAAALEETWKGNRLHAADPLAIMHEKKSQSLRPSNESSCDVWQGNVALS